MNNPRASQAGESFPNFVSVRPSNYIMHLIYANNIPIPLSASLLVFIIDGPSLIFTGELITKEGSGLYEAIAYYLYLYSPPPLLLILRVQSLRRQQLFLDKPRIPNTATGSARLHTLSHSVNLLNLMTCL